MTRDKTLTAKPSHGSHPDARAIAQSAGLPAVELKMDSAVTLQVFVLTVFMCIISGAIAINKLRTADPADIFY